MLPPRYAASKEVFPDTTLGTATESLCAIRGICACRPSCSVAAQGTSKCQTSVRPPNLIEGIGIRPSDAVVIPSTGIVPCSSVEQVAFVLEVFTAKPVENHAANLSCSTSQAMILTPASALATCIHPVGVFITMCVQLASLQPQTFKLLMLRSPHTIRRNI